MLPSILAKQLETGLGSYIETTFPMTNDPFRGSVQKLIRTKDAIYHEPYMAVRLPFRVAEKMPECFEAVHPAYLPYVHQQLAFDRLTGEDGRSTLIATDTGSGKTECFLYPILEYCYQHRGEPGIKALIIYPMNALATDQSKRIAELIDSSPELKGNVTAGMYVGGREEHPSRMMGPDKVITDHDTMLNCPPDILLTNYKMLDYLLVRPRDAALWNGNSPETLRYIAVDELHTFDGAQGTDLACLLRRLKSRLYTPSGYLCCIGTSATMGSKENGTSILDYAHQIFGEDFEQEAVITEDRLSAAEFFAGSEVTDFSMPTKEQVMQLNDLIAQDQEENYLKLAAESWLEPSDDNILSDEGRIALGGRLMHLSFMQALITLMGGKYYQADYLIEHLKVNYPDLLKTGDPESAICALFALISHARTGTPNHLRPFLKVQFQLWIRELARLVGKVSGEEVTYALADDLNTQQKKQYLPIQNCRDCGATAWVSKLNERGNAIITDLRGFYNSYFKHDDRIVMLYPYSGEEVPYGMAQAKLCPECLQVKLGEGGSSCPNCGADMIDVLIPTPNPTIGKGEHKAFKCPFCGSKHGISLMGVRSATEISASMSQMFASKFNDDKKTLAFSDNVQDSAQRAGFFNNRTWKSGFRGAVQQYVQNGGAGKSLQEFSKGFIAYWHQRMSDEDFVSFFVGPNMTWMSAFKDMVEKRIFGRYSAAAKLMNDIEKRVCYEIMLEYGLSGRIGRTLEKSGCSVICFDSNEIHAIADAVQERTFNELGDMPHTDHNCFCQMVIGYMNLMRQSGAFDDPVFYPFIKEGGKDYMLSNKHVRWLPGQRSGRNIPCFPAVQKGIGSKQWGFDSPYSPKYRNWIGDCCKEPLIEPTTLAQIGQIILEELAKKNIAVVIPAISGIQVYGLNKDRVYISQHTVQMQCDNCGAMQSVSEENMPLWENAPCFRSVCCGTQIPNEEIGLDYYGKLFSTGDLVRVNAREHTGLLERNDREQLEVDFKRKKDTSRLWDPNVLSCTPTLEMGIDIGDLSSVILCSMPPAQSQFLQRTGRAGRKDGNALTLAVANAKPHDLYFYADPLDMMEGNVTPPKIFLKASAVLERQFLAYCMDSWVRSGISENAISKNVGGSLSKLNLRSADIFPFNFLSYIQKRTAQLLRSFMGLFPDELDPNAEQELRAFANGKGLTDSPMSVRILKAFEELKAQRDSLRQSVDQMKSMIKELEDKPKDASYEAEIKDLKRDLAGLINVVQGINNKDVFNFLSDEGLLPNYAFPESGIMLKAILYRQEDDEETKTGKKRLDKTIYEYTRAASAAISEFAPNNHFYVQGHKLKINQIDLSTKEVEKWRLCPNCSYAERITPSTNAAACPRCGSTGWADAGQSRDMLKVQMVYSNMKEEDSLISDDSENRAVTFYCKQMLVDVDEEHDITSAYRMDNEDFVFGYEFARKATLREINFGESDVTGDPMMVSGVEDIRKGFQICKYCGKIKEEKGIQHMAYCKTRKNPELAADALEDCLFLYREFQTEVLRLLIPASNNASYNVKTQSFTAAFMLGMREYFGNVDHLRAAVTEVPVQDQEYRKQYLVIYDSVPGGTGYLKQLMHNENALVEVFEKALTVLENCSCKDDPQKDGCYHCLYAYRQSQNIGEISRRVAIDLLHSILSGKDSVEKIDKIGSIPVNSLFDSELEQQFIAGFEQMGNENRRVAMAKQLLNGKEGYILKVNDFTWEIEPQVPMGMEDGVSVDCKPDFLIRPLSQTEKLPVAVFTDGFSYHHNEVAEDTLKREAIRRSGRYRVWVLSWHDVQEAFQGQKEFATNTLAAEKMPSGLKMYRPYVKGEPETIDPGKMGSFDLLMCYLDPQIPEESFKAHARACSMSILDPVAVRNPQIYPIWSAQIEKVTEATWFTEDTFQEGDTIFGIWTPRSNSVHFRAFAGIPLSVMKRNSQAPASICAVLEDSEDHKTDAYQQEWNGFWHFFNVMQFAEHFVAVSETGLEQGVYAGLRIMTNSVVPESVTADVSDGWEDIMGQLFEDEAIDIARCLRNQNIPAPDEAGYELAKDTGEVVATLELAWIAQKVGFMTGEQTEDRNAAEAAGWKIFVSSDEISNTFFGGEK